jgi:hypothetical protein
MHVVFDLDGTLTDPIARVNKHLIDHSRGYPHKRDNVDWDAFFLDCDLDEPMPHTLETLRALHSDGHKVEIWTGRGAIARQKTNDWLMLHGVPQEVIASMIMRTIGDHRDDDVMKADWTAHYGTPDLVFEDRNRVVAMWRRMGVPCFHVADGNF